MTWRYFKQKVFFSIVSLSALIIALALGGLIFYIVLHGVSAISWDFLILPPTDSMTKGGIMPAILGTLYLTIGAIAVALPLGVVSAVYLAEYAKQGKFVTFIRIGINCLAGVPSLSSDYSTWVLCCVSSLWVMHPFGSFNTRHPYLADDYRSVGRGFEIRSTNIPGSVPRPRCIEMADYL